MAQHDLSSKRKRAESLSDVEQQMDYALGGKRYQKGQSRDVMPPPPIPTQQPYVFRASNPNQDTHDTSLQDSSGRRSQSGTDPVTPHHRSNANDSTRMVLTSRGTIPQPALVAANNGGNASPSGPHSSPLRVHAARGPPLEHAFPPSRIARYERQSDGNLPLEPSSARSSSHIAQRHTQPYDHSSLLFRHEPNNRITHPYAHGNLPTSRLGLSSNARSSGHGTIQSPSNSKLHRRPLGQNTLASPHFLPRRLSNSISMSSLRSGQTTSLTNSYPSTTSTLVGSKYGDNLARAPENFNERDLGRDFMTDPGAPTFRRPDLSRGRLPTAESEGTIQRRRAHR